MSPPSFRLDHLAVLLVSRLEATRRARATDPEATTVAIQRATEEVVRGQARECRELMGDEAQAAFLERELLESFLPRYTRLALEQNADEEGRPAAVRAGNLLGRMLLTGVAFVLAAVLTRLIPGSFDLALYLLPLLGLVAPELVAWSSRRRYEARLQELVDDLERLQDVTERLPTTPEAERPQRPPAPQRIG